MRSDQDPRPAHAALRPAYGRIVASAARPCTIVRTLHARRAARASFVEPAFRSRSGCAGPPAATASDLVPIGTPPRSGPQPSRAVRCGSPNRTAPVRATSLSMAAAPDFAPQLGYWSTPLRTSSRDSSRTGTEPTFQISDA